MIGEWLRHWRARREAKRKHELFQKRYKAVMEMRAEIAALEAEAKYHEEQLKKPHEMHNFYMGSTVVACRRRLASSKVKLHALLENE